MRVNRDKKDRTSVNVPSFIRDKFKLLDGNKVDIDTDGERIIITPVRPDDRITA
jgi:bifunctional DNA-binding transcriptional regulator/antitoxin component of YhaV-PrlF toxin-antitoxin module